jgi:asparagine synthase (glutamine-hydrolysing)
MANEDGTVWTIFNGEIYNHRELRRYLEARGHIFKGRSDGEVLPHLYEEDGPAFVTRLRGMFALALYDSRTCTLILARDRFGIKPLFFAAGNHRLAFASEIRALLELPGIDKRPDRQAIYDFAALLYIPAPETVYAGIRCLEPGEMLEAKLENDRVSWRTHTYHRWAMTAEPDMTPSQAADRADSLITAAVRRQMESDVPLGALLSGGIDSSLLSVAAQKALSGRLQTFNVRFSEEAYDETWAAITTAKHIGSDHRTLDMNGNGGTWDHITGLLRHAGQPFADTSLFAVNAVCRLMRQFVTVALSGDGGDEAFGGYDLYWKIGRVVRWQRLPKAVWQGASVATLPLARCGLVPRHVPARFRALTAADNTTIVQSMYCWLSEEEHWNLCRDQDCLPVRRLFEPQWKSHAPVSASSRLERLSVHATEANVRLVLPNDYLFKVDTASMKESLEVRVPMLDEELFDFGMSLPHSLKVKGQTCKMVLRSVAQRNLPAAVANKPKRGFGLPLDNWVNAEFKTRVRDVLLGTSSRLAEFFRPEAYRPIIEAFCDGRVCPGISREGMYQRAIMLLSLQLALSGEPV